MRNSRDLPHVLDDRLAEFGAAEEFDWFAVFAYQPFKVAHQCVDAQPRHACNSLKLGIRQAIIVTSKVPVPIKRRFVPQIIED